MPPVTLAPACSDGVGHTVIATARPDNAVTATVAVAGAGAGAVSVGGPLFVLAGDATRWSGVIPHTAATPQADTDGEQARVFGGPNTSVPPQLSRPTPPPPPPRHRTATAAATATAPPPTPPAEAQPPTTSQDSGDWTFSHRYSHREPSRAS